MAVAGNLHQLFGRFIGSGSATPESSVLGESIPVGTRSRVLQGPRLGRFSLHVIPSGTFTGSLQVFYSNLPWARADTAGDWVLDTSIGTAGTVTLTSGTPQMLQAGNVSCEWIRVVVTTATGTMEISVWARPDREGY